MSYKIVNNEEEYRGLMKNLERYKFHWASGKNPTDESILLHIDFPVRIIFNPYGGCTKEIAYSHNI